jgi:hypothetical protein
MNNSLFHTTLRRGLQNIKPLNIKRLMQKALKHTFWIAKYGKYYRHPIRQFQKSACVLATSHEQIYGL